MAWDRAGESHEDQTMFGLIPDRRDGAIGNCCCGIAATPKKHRWRASSAWTTENGLILTTDYEMMSSLERFWFAGARTCGLRTSTVQGLSNNASFCMETRQLDDRLNPAITLTLLCQAQQALLPSAGKQKYLERSITACNRCNRELKGARPSTSTIAEQWML